MCPSILNNHLIIILNIDTSIQYYNVTRQMYNHMTYLYGSHKKDEYTQ